MMVLQHKIYFAHPSSNSYISRCSIIFKTEGGYFKLRHMVNVVFLVSYSIEEEISHIKSSINESMK